MTVYFFLQSLMCFIKFKGINPCWDFYTNLITENLPVAHAKAMLENVFEKRLFGTDFHLHLWIWGYGQEDSGCKLFALI